uniref:Orf117 n=1 Tax=Tetrahymena pyriformis TaxID=5908 RepID=Q9XMS5_TETPY|nr:orf117 [Tetrahymena pyriformis]AAD41939.1 orf117 [Tetrahymena pyriformis]
MILKANKYKLFTSLIITPLCVFNPITNKLPIGFGGWGVDVWPRLVVLLLLYVLVYHYLYSIFWNIVEECIYDTINWLYDKLGGYKTDPSFSVVYIEDVVVFIEYLCYHYYLYFLFIM